MAEWGKRDDRWIVENREDGQNVNQWHWSEKNCDEWCRMRLAQLFDCRVLLDTSDASAKITALEKMEGEAFLNVRKKKLIASYELKVTFAFTARVGQNGNAAKDITGKVRPRARARARARSCWSLPCILQMFS
jgi:activator of HSP90 ATPase